MRRFFLSIVMLAAGLACSRGADAAGSPASPASSGDAPPPEPVVTDDATNLLFSFVDAQGRVQAVAKAADVPEPVRARVLVVDLAKTPEQRQAHRYAFFADLTTKRPDGNYSVAVVSRYDAATGAQASASALPPPEGSILVYSASWCGFCKKAKAWLAANNVPYVERDVEKTAGAQQELDQKLRAAHTAGGGIPVIDWSGTLVMGFDKPQLEKLLREKPPTAGDAAPQEPLTNGDDKTKTHP